MKRFLHWLVDFLDRKFPDKVVVTAATYLTLKAQMETTAAILKNHADEINHLKAQMANINVAVGFAVPKAGMLER